MKRLAVMIALAAAVTSGARAEPSEPINDWKALRATIARCWTVPAKTESLIVAMFFGIAPTGRLKGPPRVHFRSFPAGSESGERYMTAANEALARCQPFNLTPGFRAMMGEALIHLRLVNSPWEKSFNIGSKMTIFAHEAGGRE